MSAGAPRPGEVAFWEGVTYAERFFMGDASVREKFLELWEAAQAEERE